MQETLVRETQGNYDEIWKINQKYIDEQIAANKKINLVNDPYKGYFFENGAKQFYQRELDYIRGKGYSFELDSDGFWKATRR